MRLMTIVAIVLLSAGQCWGQGDELDRLRSVTEKQATEIEELKARLAKIEALLTQRSGPIVEPASPIMQPAPYTVQTPDRESAVVDGQPEALAGIRLSGEFRMRFESTTRGASPSTPGLQMNRGRYRLQLKFTDNSRFLWDDDIRFNGVNERWKIGPLELRAGQYPLINPDTYSVAANSPLTLTGVKPGSIARASQLFHQGVRS